MSLYFWHSGENALVCVVPMDNGQVGAVGFKGADLRKMGWHIDDNEARAILPRFDSPKIAMDGNVQAAANGAAAARRVDQALRRR